MHGKEDRTGTCPEEGYIHFAGVHPDFREVGLARTLYQKFYDACIRDGRHVVRSCTAPVNTLSIGFHQKMGFSLEPGGCEIDGLPVTTGYLGEDDLKVVFKKILPL